MNLDNITPELAEKAKNCNSVEELLELAKSEGVELTDEQLDAVNGGSVWDWDCPLDLFLETDDGGSWESRGNVV